MLPVAVLPLLAACDVGSADVSPPSAGPDTVVLRVREWQRNPAPATDAALVPEVSLYGDGRMIVPDPHSGALLGAREYRLTPEKLRAVYRRAARAGLARGRDFSENVMDGAGMAITLRTGRGRRLTTVKGPLDGGRGGDVAEVVEFRRSLDPARWPARDFTVPPRPYRADRLAVLPFTAAGGPPRPWPIPGADFRREPRCTVLRGDRLRKAESLARGVDPATRWRRRGQAFRVLFRPLLPDEPGCSALAGGRTRP